MAEASIGYIVVHRDERDVYVGQIFRSYTEAEIEHARYGDLSLEYLICELVVRKGAVECVPRVAT